MNAESLIITERKLRRDEILVEKGILSKFNI